MNQEIQREGDATMVRVIDSIMGSGKSTTIKNELELKFKHGCTEKYIYVCPFLKHIEDEEDEQVSGFIADVPSANFKQPVGGYNPKTKEVEGKLDNLATLIIEQKNIATTHSLFKMMTNEIKELLRVNNYHIIIDEAVDLVKIFSMDDDDFLFLLENNVITLDEDTNIVEWNEERAHVYDGVLNKYQEEFKTGTIYLYNRKQTKNGTVNLLAWSFDMETFTQLNFTILTYLFEGSMMYNYFKMYGIEFEKKSIHNNKIVDYNHALDKTRKQELSKLINIYNGKLNNIGDKKTALSKSWFERNTKLRQQLKNNMVNYRKHIIKCNSEELLWTTFKTHASQIKGNGISLDTTRSVGNFLQCNEIGSNEYGDRHNIIYACNRFMPVDYKQYFEENDADVNEDLWALSTMIQFIWRSAIRNDEKINLYIPSKRMRNLLIEWLSH